MTTRVQRSFVAHNKKSIQIDFSVKKIPDAMFYEHHYLMEVALHKYLRIIGPEAFRGCEALRRINIPESVKEIGEGAFRGCSSLRSIHIPGGTITKIREETFAQSGLTTIAIPWSVVVIEKSAFAFCRSLLSVELPKRLRKIEDQAFKSCEGLLNVEIPNSVTRLGDKAFEWCQIRLTLRFGVNLERLERRFDGLPVHKVCYFQANYSEDAKIKRLRTAISPASTSSTGGKLSGLFPSCIHKQAIERPHETTSYGNFVDPFGMTPLHLLCLSARPSSNVCQMLLTNCPSDVLHRDKYGNTPMDYICMANAPVSLAKLVLNAHKTFFPEEPSSSWEYIVTRANSCNAGVLVLFFVRSATNHRVDCLGLRRWRKNISAMVGEIIDKTSSRSRVALIDEVYKKIAFYEQKEILSLLELALWKAMMDAEARGNKSKTRVISDATMRNNYRITAGAETVIPNVLPYLVDGNSTFVDLPTI